MNWEPTHINNHCSARATEISHGDCKTLIGQLGAACVFSYIFLVEIVESEDNIKQVKDTLSNHSFQ